MVEAMLIADASGAPQNPVWAPVSDFDEIAQEVINREVGERFQRERWAKNITGFVTINDCDWYAYRASAPKTVERPPVYLPF